MPAIAVEPPVDTSRHRWICLDVGETLIDETRFWTIWADELGIPLLTFMAAFGAAIERGGEHQNVFGVVGVEDWRSHIPAIERRSGGFQQTDLYPDALPSLAAFRDLGYRVAVLANQPSGRTIELRQLGVDVDVMAMSDELGIHKPDPRFFTRALELMGEPDPGDVAYVGDRVDNDVQPSAAAGMRPVWLRRGPWGVITQGTPPEAALVVGSLSELVERIESVWEPAVEPIRG